MSVLFLAKCKPFAKEAEEILRSHIKDVDVFFGNVGDPFPERALAKKYDYVISYISPWIVPKTVLNNAKIAAINLHPGPPRYPGIGCTNFAIYDGVSEFGITAHHMKSKVDSGDIILVERFPIFPHDTVYSLSQRCYVYIYLAFIKLFPILFTKGLLPQSKESWMSKPCTRKELNELCCITKDMTNEEIEGVLERLLIRGCQDRILSLVASDLHYSTVRVIR